MLAQLLQSLERRGFTDNTLVVRLVDPDELTNLANPRNITRTAGTSS
ncbi:hypothetical protein [Myxococcus qinghaiensis]|nr:hypothetical protein [Myxococcus qinghaiensis]MCP3165224.1 hypothetical protein [Myxococcus qinghaiensis]